MGVKVAPLQFIVLVASFAVLLVASDTASNGWTAPSNNSSKYKECPSGWVLAPNKTKCFGYNESLESWDESEIHCKRYHGHLAALTSFEELNFAQHLCGQSVNGCWVGGRVSNSTISSGWKWSDNTSVWNESVLRSSEQLQLSTMNTAIFVTLALLVVLASAGTSFSSFFSSFSSFGFSSFFTSAFSSFFSSFNFSSFFTSANFSSFFSSFSSNFSSGSSGSSFATALVPAVGIVCGAVVAMI